MRLKAILALTILLAILTGSGCQTARSDREATLPAYDTSTRIEQQDGLNLTIIDFTWTYNAGVNQITVTGTVKNMSDQGLQAIRFHVEAFDQFEESLGIKESFLRPTYIGPGQTAEFDFYLDKGEWVKSLHLRYYFKKRF